MKYQVEIELPGSGAWFKYFTQIDSLEEAELMVLINEMPDGYRVVFNMYAIEGYSHKEIAEQLAISENTSKSQYSRARAYLIQKLNSIGFER